MACPLAPFGASLRASCWSPFGTLCWNPLRGLVREPVREYLRERDDRERPGTGRPARAGGQPGGPWPEMRAAAGAGRAETARCGNGPRRRRARAEAARSGRPSGDERRPGRTAAEAARNGDAMRPQRIRLPARTDRRRGGPQRGRLPRRRARDEPQRGRTAAEAARNGDAGRSAYGPRHAQTVAGQTIAETGRSGDDRRGGGPGTSRSGDGPPRKQPVTEMRAAAHTALGTHRPSRDRPSQGRAAAGTTAAEAGAQVEVQEAVALRASHSSMRTSGSSSERPRISSTRRIRYRRVWR